MEAVVPTVNIRDDFMAELSFSSEANNPHHTHRVSHVTARVAPGSDALRVFRLPREDYLRIVKLYPMDEDVSCPSPFIKLI